MSLAEFLDLLNKAGGLVKALAVAVFVYAVGWSLLISAGWRLVKWADPRRQYGAPSVIVRSVVGTLFIQSAAWLNMVTLTFTGYQMPSDNAMSVMPSGGGTVASMVFSTALVWLGTLGVIAILRGTHLMVKAADSVGQSQASDQDPLFTGVVYIVSGAIGVNLWRFVGGLI